ncbi:hypothetical protein P171DRAFT_491946 [Karstenula rhodostoma CBS 690.94]|uniref:Uncharacterized protein n=1 Tax=Karstenula rhodostoma CBS 690.94 TaxID=1392251 RepID=A0A9P4P3F6_9PLEO|nr:hypothetical protein P171DRAFT_491946 [Karstenula rhodostoma CBS 690.94]
MSSKAVLKAWWMRVSSSWASRCFCRTSFTTTFEGFSSGRSGSCNLKKEQAERLLVIQQGTQAILSSSLLLLFTNWKQARALLQIFVEDAEKVSVVSRGFLILASIPKRVASVLSARGRPSSLVTKEPIEQTDRTVTIMRRNVAYKAEVVVIELSEQSEKVASTLQVKTHVQESAD